MKRLLLIVLLLALAAPATAAQWNWYGTVRTHIGNFSTDENYYGGPTMDGTVGSYGEEDSGTFVNVAGNNAVGAVAKVSDRLTGAFEMGITNAGLGVGDDPYDTESVYLRAIYGKYQMGPVTMLVGKYYTPATFLLYSGMTADIGDMGDTGMVTSGIPYAGRRAQVRFSVAGLDVAVIEHIVSSSANVTPIAGYTDADFSIPKIELAYQWNAPIIGLRPILGYQSYSVEDNANDEAETITSMLYGLGINLRLGRVKINLTGAMSTNPNQYGIKNGVSALAGLGSARVVDGDIEDGKLLQSSFVINYNINEILTIEGGYGYIKAEQKVAVDTDQELESNLWYLNVPIKVAPGLEITPEIGTVTRGDVKQDGDTVTECGAMSWASVRFAVSF